MLGGKNKYVFQYHKSYVCTEMIHVDYILPQGHTNHTVNAEDIHCLAMQNQGISTHCINCLLHQYSGVSTIAIKVKKNISKVFENNGMK